MIPDALSKTALTATRTNESNLGPCNGSRDEIPASRSITNTRKLKEGGQGYMKKLHWKEKESAGHSDYEGYGQRVGNTMGTDNRC